MVNSDYHLVRQVIRPRTRIVNAALNFQLRQRAASELQLLQQRIADAVTGKEAVLAELQHTRAELQRSRTAHRT